MPCISSVLLSLTITRICEKTEWRTSFKKIYIYKKCATSDGVWGRVFVRVTSGFWNWEKTEKKKPLQINQKDFPSSICVTHFNPLENQKRATSCHFMATIFISPVFHTHAMNTKQRKLLTLLRSNVNISRMDLSLLPAISHGKVLLLCGRIWGIRFLQNSLCPKNTVETLVESNAIQERGFTSIVFQYKSPFSTAKIIGFFHILFSSFF